MPWSEDDLREYHAKRQGRAEAKQEARQHQKVVGRSKMRNKKTIVDGIVFDSGLESRRYVQLKRLQEANVISQLRLQVPYKLVVNGFLIATYIADFTYFDCDGKFVVEDAKGFPNDRYPMKKKLMLACHGISIIEYRESRRARKP